MSIIREICRVHIEYQNVWEKIVRIFLTYQKVFVVAEAYAPMWQSEFPENILQLCS